MNLTTKQTTLHQKCLDDALPGEVVNCSHVDYKQLGNPLPDTHGKIYDFKW